MKTSDNSKPKRVLAIIKQPGEMPRIVKVVPKYEQISKTLKCDDVSADSYRPYDVDIWFDDCGLLRERPRDKNGKYLPHLNVATRIGVLTGPVLLLGLDKKGRSVGLTPYQARLGMHCLAAEHIDERRYTDAEIESFLIGPDNVVA